MVTVCCSMTSWIATRSISDILSNSSIQTTPLSARTMAPASRRRSPVSLSVVTAAVRPTPDDPRPVVAIANGAVFRTKRRSWDFAVDGSPTIRILMSLVLAGLKEECVPANVGAVILEIFLASTEKEEKNSFFDLIMAENTRCETSGKKVKHVLILGQSSDIPEIRVCDGLLSNSSTSFARQQNNIIGRNKGSESRR